MGEKSIFLKDGIQLPFIRGKIGNIFSVKKNLPLVRRFKTSDNPKGSGFAASAWTQQGQKLIFPDIKTHIVQNNGRTKRFCDMLQINQSVAHMYAPFLRSAVVSKGLKYQGICLKNWEGCLPI